MEMVTNQTEWQELAAEAPFTQAWEWGEFQKSLGIDIWRLGVRRDGKLVVGALVIKRVMPGGLCWLYSPRGPVGMVTGDAWKELEEALVELARKEGAVFIKIEPEAPAEDWRMGRSVQPMHTSILDVQADDDDLLKGMHQKTRYNIKLAQRKGVRTEFSTGAEAVETFLKLSRDVAERGAFRFHPDDYYRKMQEVLSPAGMFEIGVAYKDEEPLAAHILISYGGIATYAHGASSSLSRPLMAPVLLQWDSIKRARDEGMKQYDFYGVAPEGEENHPWAGITRFKLGFGGRRVKYAGAFDYPVKPGWFLIYGIGRRLVG